MKPVDQTVFTKGDGDCFPACLASILELPLSGVPCFLGDDWHARYEEWLGALGMGMVSLATVDGLGESWRPPGYSILAAQSPRWDCLHAVVALNGEVVWDPHPGRAMGVGEWREWTVFLALDPAQVAAHGREARIAELEQALADVLVLNVIEAKQHKQHLHLDVHSAERVGQTIRRIKRVLPQERYIELTGGPAPPKKREPEEK